MPGQVIRMGVPPLRLELLTSISGVEFEECFAVREEADIDGVRVPLIRLEDLIKNKRATRPEGFGRRARTRIERRACHRSVHTKVHRPLNPGYCP